ncbi:MAG: hypothetical protein EA398_03875 [Deltaproteobacteria bacterium]|nr:MAG: hypothetical protein EA398_03875 [Deltaproteobacteria bacterium]
MGAPRLDRGGCPRQFLRRRGSMCAELGIPSPVLLVVAHPDDESWIFGPLAVAIRRAGGRVHLLCATDGGAWRPRRGPRVPEGPEAVVGVCAMRARERRRAARVLGLGEVLAPGLADGALAEAPEALAHALRHALVRLRPATLLTHAPDGDYGHPDHAALWAAAARLVEREPRTVRAFGWPEWRDGMLDPVRTHLRRAGLTLVPAGTARRPEGVVVREPRALEPAALRDARRALAAHRSQLGARPPGDLLGRGVVSRWWRTQRFRMVRRA